MWFVNYRPQTDWSLNPQQKFVLENMPVEKVLVNGKAASMCSGLGKNKKKRAKSARFYRFQHLGTRLWARWSAIIVVAGRRNSRARRSNSAAYDTSRTNSRRCRW